MTERSASASGAANRLPRRGSKRFRTSAIALSAHEHLGSAPEVNLDSGRPQTPDDTLAPKARSERIAAASCSHGLPTRRLSATHSPQSQRHPCGGRRGRRRSRRRRWRARPKVAAIPISPSFEDAMGSGNFDIVEARAIDPLTPKSGRAGGGVGGMPSGKRAR